MRSGIGGPIKGLHLNVVQDFKQLGFTCTGIHKAPTQEAEAAAEEARLRTTRTQYLPLNREEKKQTGEHLPHQGVHGGHPMGNSQSVDLKEVDDRRRPSHLGQRQDPEVLGDSVGSAE